MKKNISESKDLNKEKYNNKFLVILELITITLLTGFIIYEILYKNNNNEDKLACDKCCIKSINSTDNKLNKTDDLSDYEYISQLVKTNRGIVVDKYKNDADEIYSIMDTIKDYSLYALARIPVNSEVSFTNDNITNDMLEAMDLTFNNQYGYMPEIKKETADNYFKNAFNFTTNEYSDILCRLDNLPIYNYDNTRGVFTEYKDHPGHGGRDETYGDYIITDFEKNGNKYTIGGYFLTLESVDSSAEINKQEIDTNHLNYDSMALINKKLIEEFRSDDEMDKKYPKYFMTFEKEGEKYFIRKISLKK